ncbi:hypothetical protein ES703_96777 [subsurface metagenome]
MRRNCKLYARLVWIVLERCLHSTCCCTLNNSACLCCNIGSICRVDHSFFVVIDKDFGFGQDPAVILPLHSGQQSVNVSIAIKACPGTAVRLKIEKAVSATF